jgi:DNA polymerase-3 subunit alpha
MYINCRSYFSLKYGTLSPAQLVEAAAKRGLSSLALTDINNTSAALEFVQLCQKKGIKPLIGIEFRQDNKWLYTGIARNLEGFKQLNELLTQHSLAEKPLPPVPPFMKHTFIIYPKRPKPIIDFRENEFLGIRPEDVSKLPFSNVKNHLHKLVALQPITFLNKEGYRLHQLLRAIDLNTLLSKLSTTDMAHKGEYFIPKKIFQQFYAIFPRILKNTAALMNACSIQFETSNQHNRQTFTGCKKGDFDLLKKLALNGCEQRYGNHPQALERTEKELKTIQQLDFSAYFLITWDIIRYASSMGHHHVGRGSGANSIVAYCLNITDVDPLGLDLYFERFLNLFRKSPPDFDIDFSWDVRDDVIDYIFKRYGREYTALLATYNTFKGRSTIRELGKVFGLPKQEIDKIVHYPEAREQHHELATELFKYGKQLEGFPNYLSIHAGGIIISEKPINYFTALQLMPKGFPITHFDMHHGERWGFEKYDILSQRGLGHIKTAVQLIKRNQGRAVAIQEVEQILADEKVKKQLQSGNCMGCFYIESPAMRGLLKKLRCDNYKHLVAASSIIRPGVAKSGMMRAYIQRFHRPYSFEYLHPVFEEHLSETFGIMVYQEDTMKIVHHFAGLDLDESDVLRRIMSGKKYEKSMYERLRAKYFKNCKERNYSEALTKEVWRQIESFSGYSFCKAHSASYAVESFQSLYLKAYYPLEFIVAVINNFGGFYQTEYYFHEAKRAGGILHAPCVNQSEYLTNLAGNDIYIGFIHIERLERKVVRNILKQRQQKGAFRSLADFVNRVAISAEQLELLIRIGAFRFTGSNKYELMWEKNRVFNPKQKIERSTLLFSDLEADFQLPNLEEGPFDQAFDELELLGFSLRSPFELLKKSPTPIAFISVENLAAHLGKIIWIEGYYVCRKRVRTVKNTLMSFGTWIDRAGHFFDTTHFPPVLKKFPFRGKGIYAIKAKVVQEFDFISLEVVEMTLLPMVVDWRYGDE